jgi:hypothetical protein
MKKLQILDMDALTSRAKQLAVSASDPHAGCGHIQIPHCAVGPTVYTASFLTATMTDGLKAFVGLSLNARFAAVGQNRLTENFDSTKGEI